MNFNEEFKNPTVKNRIKPFWFWNGDLTKEEIKHQILEMKDKGIGGAFICARQGMTVPYLSKKWFELVKYACEEAVKIGLENWLYDEYPYPSGVSGGEVLLENPDAIHTVLQTYKYNVSGETEISIELPFSKVLYAKAFKQNEDGSLDFKNTIDLTDNIGNLQKEEIYQQTGLTKYNNKRFFSYGPVHILECVLPKGNYQIEVFTQEEIKDFKYYGTYFDPCNSDAVKSFLKTTHEKYKSHIGEEFGKTVFGMFSDETGFLGKIPWSKKVIEFFREENGYDLIEVLPALTNNDFENAFKIRYDFMQTIHKLFVSSYHKQVADWCTDNNLFYATEVPSLRMTTQRHSDIIGGDACHEKLGQKLDWIYDTYIPYYRSNVKSVYSLAKQLDRKYCMIESFHSIGWSMTIQDAKIMIDYMGVNGINLFNFHAFYYTIDSITKHDAPPSQFTQNPYWKHYRLLADYVGRVSVYNTYTTADTKIAVLDPVVSLMMRLANPARHFGYMGDDKNEKVICDYIRNCWVEVCKIILFEQLDYDHLDSEILREAKVENGHIVIGRAKYSTLVLPPCESIEVFGTEKIEEFLESGGKVIFVGQLPSIIIDTDNDIKTHYLNIAKHKNATLIESDNFLNDSLKKNEFIECLHKNVDMTLKFEVSEEDKKDCLTSVRTDNNGEYSIFISNQSDKIINGKVLVNNDAKYAYKLCFETGNKYLLEFTGEKLEVSLPAFESVCILFINEEQKEAFKIKEQRNIYKINTSEEMSVSIKGQNIFRFEYFDISVDKQNWQRVDTKTLIEQVAETKIINGDNLKFNSAFGTPKKINIDYPVTVYYKENFTVKDVPKNINILMDSGTITGKFIIKVNNNIVSNDSFISVRINDQENIVSDITKFIKLGENKLEIEVVAEKDSDGIRDIVYLCGDFGVYKESDQMVISSMPTRAKYTNSFTEGLPFYSGETIFSKALNLNDREVNEITDISFDFDNDRYECIEVIVNEQTLGVRAFTPYIYGIEKGILKNGENEIIIKVANSLANMLDGTYFDYKNHKLIKI